MKKTLTEQWKNGELIFGKTYWCSDDEGNIAKLVLVSEDRFYEWTLGTEATKDVKEVLAPVPSYDEYNELMQKMHILNEQNTKQYNELCEEIKKNNILEKKLEIATKALGYYTLEDAYVSCYGKPVNPNPMVARKALKEMEGVK